MKILGIDGNVETVGFERYVDPRMMVSITTSSCSEFLHGYNWPSSDDKASLQVDLCLIHSNSAVQDSIPSWLRLEAASHSFYVACSMQDRRQQGSMFNQSEQEKRARGHKQGKNISLKTPPH